MAVELMRSPDHPGEFRRETGLGTITKLDTEPGKRNAQVSINAEHLKDPVTGWVDTTKKGLYGATVEAFDNGYRIAYVIDTHRKANVDIDKPFDDLARVEKVRDAIDIYRVDGRGAPLPTDGNVREAPPRQANPGEEPPPSQAEALAAAFPGAEPSTSARGDASPSTSTDTSPGGPTKRCAACGQPLGTLPFRRGPQGNVHVDCPASSSVDHEAAQAEAAATEDASPPIGAGNGPSEPPGASEPPATPDPTGEDPGGDEAAQEPPTPPNPLRPPDPRPARRGARIEEAKPWERYNTDGSINLGSYAYGAALGMVELAAELIVGRLRSEWSRNGGQMGTVPPAQVTSLARWLLNAADAIQANTRTDGQVDRGDSSHTRARGAVRAAIELYPIEWGATPEQRLAWRNAIVDYGTTLLKVAITLYEPELDPEAGQ